jgi:hypothetical protein
MRNSLRCLVVGDTVPLPPRPTASLSRPLDRDNPLWIAIFNAMPVYFGDKYLVFSRRVAMADAAWRIAVSDTPVSL